MRASMGLELGMVGQRGRMVKIGSQKAWTQPLPGRGPD